MAREGEDEKSGKITSTSSRLEVKKNRIPPEDGYEPAGNS